MNEYKKNNNDIVKNLFYIKQYVPKYIKIVAVSKNQNISSIKQLYDAGHRDFGENYVQEMRKKMHILPKDIKWHMIGQIQKNKLKYIVPYIYLIHSVQKSEHIYIINKIGKKYNKIVNCLLQIKICKEKNKSGITEIAANGLMQYIKNFENIKINGIMGMGSNNIKNIKREFIYLNKIYKSFKTKYGHKILSMGMSKDYKLAIQNGSTILRLGSCLFGCIN